MARVPTIAEEDARRPTRERECLVGERTRLVNRMKGTLARLGIRNFRPTLRNAAEHLAALSTPEGSPLPPNVAAELERDIARLRLVIGQIKQIEEARRQRLEEQPERGPHAMVRLLARVVGIGIETADMLVHEVLSRPMRDRRAVARARHRRLRPRRHGHLQARPRPRRTRRLPLSSSGRLRALIRATHRVVSMMYSAPAMALKRSNWAVRPRPRERPESGRVSDADHTPGPGSPSAAAPSRTSPGRIIALIERPSP